MGISAAVPGRAWICGETNIAFFGALLLGAACISNGAAPNIKTLAINSQLSTARNKFDLVLFNRTPLNKG
jgi:hypothetical protein